MKGVTRRTRESGPAAYLRENIPDLSSRNYTGELQTVNYFLTSLRTPGLPSQVCILTEDFRSFHTAARAPEGIESMHMLRKGQVERLGGRDAKGQARFVAGLSGIAA